jgi:DNA-3-methyladenine glycosylase II
MAKVQPAIGRWGKAENAGAHDPPFLRKLFACVKPNAVDVLDDVKLAAAVKALCRREPRFKPVVKAHGIPSLRAGEPDFKSLLIIVTEQFLSLSAAAAIWARIERATQPVTPQRMAAVPIDTYRALGLSQAKAKAFIGIAEACRDGAFDLASLTTRDDAEVHKALVALPGFGPWSAEIFMLANLKRPDVFPAGDFALQAAAQDLLGLELRPDIRTIRIIAEAWSPYRAVAARLLWSHYRGMKSLPQA